MLDEELGHGRFDQLARNSAPAFNASVVRVVIAGLAVLIIAVAILTLL